MSQRKQIARGSRVLIGTAPSGTLAPYGRVETCTLPTQDYETIEAPELNPQDDAGVPIASDPVEFGDEILGTFEFTHYWDPRDADGTLLDGYWANKTLLVFAFDTPHATQAARITCQGRIKTLAPEQLTKNGFYKRTVTVQRTSQITNAAKPA